MATARDKGRPLRELAELLRARDVDAVYHPSDGWGRGYGWIALNSGGRRGCDDAVWYLRAGTQVNCRRLEQPEVVWGGHFQHHAPADDLAAAADRITGHLVAQAEEAADGGSRPWPTG
jgi:hypothetical protein